MRWGTRVMLVLALAGGSGCAKRGSGGGARDAGRERDAGVDAGATDAGTTDAGPRDAGSTCVPIPWTRETALGTGDVNLMGSMAVGPDGVVHVSLGLERALGLRYIRRNGPESWAIEEPPQMGSPNYSTLALDDDGGVHIVFRDTASASLRIGSADRAPDGTWTAGTVDASGNPTDPSLTVALGALHASYQGEGGGLSYATRPLGGFWAITLVENGILAGNTTIAVGADGSVHVAYLDQITRVARYATRPASGSWTYEVIAAGSTGGPRAIAVDAAGAVHVTLGTDAGLVYARRESSGWAFEAADPAAAVGYQSSLAFDAAGDLHVSYKHATGDGVWYARRRAATGDWAVMPLNPAASYLGPTSLAVDATGMVHVAYTDNASNLIYDYTRECP